ncbi:hypothetical protein HDV01_001548 [Terramyces sp. JEL0728]|nr:hypothetical protein HDV01_001548 [Terramyces sp. JEL0728]
MDALQTAVEKAKKDQARYDNEYNLALSQEKRRREEAQKAYEAELDTREIISNINGTFLSEQPNVFGNDRHKVRVDLFKGFSPSQKQEILNIRDKQRQDNHKTKLQKQKDQEEWELRDLANRRTIELLDREKNRKSRELAVRIRQENQLKAEEDKKRFLVFN